jgi:hypothetical protein
VLLFVLCCWVASQVRLTFAQCRWMAKSRPNCPLTSGVKINRTNDGFQSVRKSVRQKNFAEAREKKPNCSFLIGQFCVAGKTAKTTRMAEEVSLQAKLRCFFAHSTSKNNITATAIHVE